MADKTKGTTGFKKMNRAEFAINKPILREANMKFKDQSVAPTSIKDDKSVMNNEQI